MIASKAGRGSLQCLSAECLGGTFTRVINNYLGPNESPMPFGCVPRRHDERQYPYSLENACLQCLSAECLGGTVRLLRPLQADCRCLQCLSAECLSGTISFVEQIYRPLKSPMPFGCVPWRHSAIIGRRSAKPLTGLQCLSAECLGGTTEDIPRILSVHASPMPFG